VGAIGDNFRYAGAMRFFVVSNLVLLSFGLASCARSAALPLKLSSVSTQKPPDFLVLGGGGAPSYNEIAIEKNVLYFQRTLKKMGFDPDQASIYFANGNDGAKTIRYFDPAGKEKFKTPEIPGVLGSATWKNVQDAIAKAKQSSTKQPSTKQPLFFYFTGHGSHNEADENNNAMILWNEREVNVKQFTRVLDQLPETKPFVTVMVQCYAGAFANMIYQKGDPKQPIALQTRCGFFATIKQQPSVGCTAEVDEADYQDYSSSFFAGLSGVNRVGKPVTSADYNRDGQVSFAEAHGFAKVDEQAADLPISTLEAWLRDRLSNRQIKALLDQPIDTIIATARPEQKYVVKTLAQQYQFDLTRSFPQNMSRKTKDDNEQRNVFLERLRLELINIAAESDVQSRGVASELAILDRLVNCEAGFWREPS
jgi:Caspase domain